MPLKLLFFFYAARAIKVAPVLQALRTNHELRPVVVVSGRHRQMLDQVLTLFDISPDFDSTLSRSDKPGRDHNPGPSSA